MDKVVYPTSPLTVVAVVIENVLESTPNLSAAPREGVVAAIVNPAKPNTSKTSNKTLEIFCDMCQPKRIKHLLMRILLLCYTITIELS